MIWGDKWDKKYDDKPELIAEEWTDALAGLNRQAIKQGLSKTRQTLVWPPTIAEFLQASQGADIAADSKSISVLQAADIASKLIKAKLPSFTGKEEFYRDRAIYVDLYSRIFSTQNENCDFAICTENCCYHYQIFDNAHLGMWRCIKHCDG